MMNLALHERKTIGYRRSGEPIYEIAGGAVTAAWYGLAFSTAFNKEMDLDTDTLKVMLTTVTYVPNQDTHQYKSSVTNEISGTGYTATGVALTGVTAVGSQYTGGTNTWALDANDASWTTASFTMRIAVVYDSSPATDATRPLLSYVDAGADQTVSAGTFSLVWAAGGIISVVVS